MLAVPMLFELTFDAMQEMDRSNQSSILAVVGLLMAAAIVGVFEATYQKTNIHQQSHRLLAHLTKALLLIGISEQNASTSGTYSLKNFELQFISVFVLPRHPVMSSQPQEQYLLSFYA